MSLSDYAAGCVFALLTGGAAVATAAVLARRYLPAIRGSARAVLLGLLVTGGLVVAHLVPAALGVLSRWTVTAAALAELAIASWVVRRGAAPAGAPVVVSKADSRSRLSPVIAAVGVTLLAGWIVAGTRSRGATAINSIDLLTFNLPLAGRWIQDHNLWQLADYFPLQSHGSYPHDGDLLILGSMLPWRSDFLVRFVQYPFFVLAGTAVYALARELRAEPPAALLAAGACLAIPAMSFTAFIIALPDTVLLAALAGGTLFLVRHSRTGTRTDLVVAGLGFGIAFGTKWYGPTTIAVLLAVWASASWLAGRPLRRIAGDGGLLVTITLALGGFWLVRNAIVYGNPVYPASIRAFGVTLLSSPPDIVRRQVGFTLADYIGNGSVWRGSIWPGLWAAFGLGGAVLLGGAIVTIAAHLRHVVRRRPSGEVVLPVVLAATALLLAGLYLVTPDSALGPRGHPDVQPNARYGMPAALMAAPVLAWLAGRFSRLGFGIELLMLAAIVDALGRRGLDTGTGAALLTSVALVVLLWAIWAARGRVREAVRARRWLGAAAAAALILAVAAFGYREQRRFFKYRYGDDTTFAHVGAKARSGHRVAVGGLWTLDQEAPVWPMYGPRIGNRVAYAGYFHRDQLRRYSTYGAWRAGLERGRFDLLEMGSVPSPERDWPIRAGFRELARSPRLRLYAIGGS